MSGKEKLTMFQLLDKIIAQAEKNPDSKRGNRKASTENVKK